MKKILYSLIILMAFIIIPNYVQAEAKNESENKNEVTIYLFRSSRCQHCEEALNYLNNNRDQIPEGVKFVTYQVYNHEANRKVLETIQKNFKFKDDDIGSVPLFLVGEKYVFGYSGPADFKKAADLAKDAQNSADYHDYVSEVIKELGVKAKSTTLEQIFPEPNKVVTIIVFGIFGAIVLGFGAMIIFSRKS